MWCELRCEYGRKRQINTTSSTNPITTATAHRHSSDDISAPSPAGTDDFGLHHTTDCAGAGRDRASPGLTKETRSTRGPMDEISLLIARYFLGFAFNRDVVILRDLLDHLKVV